MKLCQVNAMWQCLCFQNKQTNKKKITPGANDSWNVENQDLGSKNLDTKVFLFPK